MRLFAPSLVNLVWKRDKFNSTTRYILPDHISFISISQPVSYIY